MPADAGPAAVSWPKLAALAVIAAAVSIFQDAATAVARGRTRVLLGPSELTAQQRRMWMSMTVVILVLIALVMGYVP